ncbi:MAG: ankyrin repeat domain-containing protein [Bdellovibrionales bacterium]|nr:ankyrin repeat domain-containing protein [Bdellovibrionales bacterium]
MKHTLVSFGLVSIALAGCGGQVESSPSADVSIHDVGEKVGARKANGVKCATPTAEVAGAFAAIDRPDHQNLDEYLDAHSVSKDARNENCETLYFHAIAIRNDADRAVLEERGYAPDPAVKDEKLEATSKEFALSHGSIATIGSFKKGEYQPASFSDEEFRLVLASNSRDVVAWVLKNGHPGLEGRPNYQEPNYLIFAIENLRPKAILEQLIDAGAPIDADTGTQFGFIVESPLQAATRVGHRDAVALLLSKRVKTSLGTGADRPKALFAAIALDRPDIVELLIEAGANLNASEPVGEVMNSGFENTHYYLTAYAYALANGKTKAAAALAHYGAIDLKQSPFEFRNTCPNPRPIVARAFQLATSGDVAGLKNHLAANAISVDSANSACETLYAAAIRANQTGVIALLEDSGYGLNDAMLDLSIGGNNGFFSHRGLVGKYDEFLTPMSILLQSGTVSTFEFFRQKDQNKWVGLRWDGSVNYGMEMAAAGANPDPALPEYFLSKYAPNPKEWMHNEPAEILGTAARASNIPWVKAMLARGTPVNDACDVWNKTPLMLAAQSGSAETIRILLAAGASKESKDAMLNTPLNYAKGRPAEILDLLKP